MSTTAADSAFQKQRIAIGLAIESNPPWTNHCFVCERCGAKYQLGAADECQSLHPFSPPDGDLWLAPPCWGRPAEGVDCGFRNTIKTPLFAQEGNPS
jgi:hypothetical protein